MIIKRICLVIPSLQAGGMERVMAELAGYFAGKDGVEVHLILYDLSREIFYQVPQSVLIYKPAFKFNKKRRLFNTLKTLIFLRKTIIKINADTILSFGEYWNSFVLIALLGLPYPIYISDRCSPEKRFSAIHSLLRRVLYPKASGIIAQTETAREYYYRSFRHPNIRVIGNPVRLIPDIDQYVRENIVLTVGRLIKTKNQDKLVELFLDLNITGWKLVLVGYDHLKQKNAVRLERIIEQRNGQNKVLLVGKHSDVDSFYRSSKIFAFTSSSEGFPNVIGEAMSAGLPVIAFDCVAGPSEMIIDNHDGYLIPLFDYKQFSEKLQVLINNEELRTTFGRNAAESIKRFSVKTIAEKYLDFIMN